MTTYHEHEVATERQREVDERADRKASYDWWWHRLKRRDPEKGADLSLAERMALFAAEDEVQRSADQIDHDAYMARWRARRERRRARAASVVVESSACDESPRQVDGAL